MRVTKLGLPFWYSGVYIGVPLFRQTTNSDSKLLREFSDVSRSIPWCNTEGSRQPGVCLNCDNLTAVLNLTGTPIEACIFNWRKRKPTVTS